MSEQSSTAASEGTSKVMLNRRRMLALGAAGLGALVGPMALSGAASAAAATPAPDLGISPTNSGAVNRRNLVKALSGTSASITFPPGDYKIDNSKAANPPGRADDKAVVIDNFSGVLDMQSGARLIFTDPSQGGLYFACNGKTGPTLTGVTTTYSTLPTNRTSTGAVMLDAAVDAVVRNISITGSTGGGLGFWNCIRPSVDGAQIRNTMADGVHFGTCQDGKANKVYTYDTGDDGLAFVNYGNPARTGGHATNIQVVRSGARGVTVIGQSGVTIDHFGVNWSKAAGILCATEGSYNTEVPTDVTFKNGFVYNGGAFEGGKAGNDFGIAWDLVGEIRFINIRVRTPGNRGVTGVAKAFTHKRKNGTTTPWPAGTVHLDGITVTDAPGSGFDVQGGNYRIGTLTATDTGGTGFAVLDTATLTYSSLTAIRTSKTGSLHRAFSFERNARVDGKELRIEDDQAAPTGYVAGFFGAQQGNAGTIYANVPNGKVEISNPSKLTYTTG